MTEVNLDTIEQVMRLMNAHGFGRFKMIVPGHMGDAVFEIDGAKSKLGEPAPEGTGTPRFQPATDEEILINPYVGLT